MNKIIIDNVTKDNYISKQQLIQANYPGYIMEKICFVVGKMTLIKRTIKD